MNEDKFNRMKAKRNMNQIKDILFNKNPMLVLSYLTRNPHKNNMATHIAKELSLSAVLPPMGNVRISAPMNAVIFRSKTP